MTDSDRARSTDPDRTESGRSLAPLMGATYVAAGTAHFLAPKRFAEAVPPAFPRPARLAAWIRLPFQGVLVGWALRYARPEEPESTAAVEA
ncbi:MAG: hypothetical protein ACOC06_02880 [Halorubrum sp.]